MAEHSSSKRPAKPPGESAPTAPGVAEPSPTAVGTGTGGSTASGSLPQAPSASPAVRLFWPLLVAALVTLVLVTLPRLPLGEDDSSGWGAALGYAHQHGLQFGTDVVFTYGPLGFLITPFYCPQAPSWRLVSDIGLSFVSIFGLCLLAWRVTRPWRWLLLGAFLFLAGNAEPRHEILLNVGLLSWALCCLVESGRRLVGGAVMLVGLAVFAALAKVTYLFLAPLGLLGLACDFALRGRTRFGAGLLVGFGAGLVLAWVSLGQALTHLGLFLRSALSLSSGYDQAMQLTGLSTLGWTAALMLATALGTVVLRSCQAFVRTEKHFGWRRVVLLLWLSGWLFLIWKHGLARAGRDHTELFLVCVPVLTLLVEALPGAKTGARYLARGLGITCCLLATFGWQYLFAGDFKACVIHPVRLAGEHLQALVHPFARGQRLRDLQDTSADALQMPRLKARIGQASVDVFGFNQSYAVLNGLNYRPRPVFQSYAAYNEQLMRLNEQFYFSPAAPEYVLFRLLAIDDRFPPLEDAMLLPVLLRNYEPVDAEGPFLLLKSKRTEAARLDLLREGEVHPGELIDLTPYTGADLWLELHPQLSAAGRTRTMFYQAPRIELGVWCRGGANLRLGKFRAAAPMLNAGFLASPLVLDDQDVLDLYTGAAATRPVAYSVELEPGNRAYWEDPIGYRVYRLSGRLGYSASPELSRLLKYPGFDATPAAIVSSTNAILQVRNQPALFLPPRSYMRFAVPRDARFVKGSFGFAPAAYALGGATEGAEFRIEEELPDGQIRLVLSRILLPATNPDDRGLIPFLRECPGQGERQLLFRILPVAGEHPKWDLTCWAGIGFK